MHIASVEIYSDQTNAAIMRHPDRHFPGVLIQGDSLHALCLQADETCAAAKGGLDPEAYGELNELRNALWGYLNHYKVVLGEHKIGLPFSDGAGA
ncbi:hypothetical protein ABFU27_20530 [Xanthomonas campestris pv. raphani]|uniref:DUF6959 family protein n=1 Tax=Xanthomonas campestris TaxID=339 RepID=UPI001E4D120B|nr:hypothetical protein [Xanthomonas campestris]MCC8686296.1 hypothetical protein [Xanthomonas campestris]MCW2001025.1 hypothetical protein [Xanthomonas campestris]MEA9680785.1 hypothetical protein [Xanthomonas campestris pv. raphani]MEA9701105.1 hypothetical protein [Xanthomonas campestris pv. raphani]MEA9781381.1 hypothetical protein [Xanthomonas campestris pv. raphani]